MQTAGSPSTRQSNAALAGSKSRSSGRNFDSYIREYCLLAEYKQISLKLELLRGVYIMPSLTETHTWHGVIFIHSGTYKNGIFKFQIEIPKSYPDSQEPPQVKFLTKVYHPAVDKANGHVNVSRWVPVWKKNEHFLWMLVLYIKKLFYEQVEKMVVEDGLLNRDAAHLFQQDPSAYLSKCRECAHASTLAESISAHDDASPIKFSQWETKYELAHQKLANDAANNLSRSGRLTLSSFRNGSETASQD